MHNRGNRNYPSYPNNDGGFRGHESVEEEKQFNGGRIKGKN